MKKITILLAAVLFAATTMAQVAINKDDSDANAASILHVKGDNSGTAVEALYIESATGNVGIGTIAPESSALLDVNSTTKGFLPPRMTEVQMNAIASPVAGLTVYCTDCSPKSLYVYDGFDFGCMQNGGNPSGLAETDVYNPATGKIWMDRNLGATQVATSKTDAAAYGYLYQWGRATEGHEQRGSSNTSLNAIATTAVPGTGSNAWDGKFIRANTGNWDWLDPQDDNLWQGEAGTNNPCPTGYRLPTSLELDDERATWETNDADGAFGSLLKITLNGFHHSSSGSISNEGAYGYYWSSTVTGGGSPRANYLIIREATAGINGISNYVRSNGYAVRCIKD